MALYAGAYGPLLGAKGFAARPLFRAGLLFRRRDGKAGKLDGACRRLALRLLVRLGLAGGYGKDEKSEDENETEGSGEKHRKSPFRPRTGPVSNRGKGASTIIQGTTTVI